MQIQKKIADRKYVWTRQQWRFRCVLDIIRVSVGNTYRDRPVTLGGLRTLKLLQKSLTLRLPGHVPHIRTGEVPSKPNDDFQVWVLVQESAAKAVDFLLVFPTLPQWWILRWSKEMGKENISDVSVRRFWLSCLTLLEQRLSRTLEDLSAWWRGFLEGTQQDFSWPPELQYFWFSGASAKSDIVRRFGVQPPYSAKNDGKGGS